MIRSIPFWTLVAILGLSACNSGTDSDTGQEGVARISVASKPQSSTSGLKAKSAATSEVISSPAHELMTQTAPDTFKVLFHTSAGDFVVQVNREWAPIGSERFYNLIINKYYDQNFKVKLYQKSYDTRNTKKQIIPVKNESNQKIISKILEVVNE